jgi:esterase FrsA
MDIIRHLLGFAPLTDLTSIAEFKTLDVAHWNLKELCIALSTKTIRCYIGNRDTRVGTDKCFDWLYQTSERAFQKGIRSPPIELRIVPSIGREGHGTAPQHFREGASWLLKQMGALHEA